MAYKALYRTYRPQTFKEVVGQDVIVKTLQNAIKSNKISHAYLFCGPRGTGKTTIARIFSKALNCVNRNETEPCNECSVCQEITSSICPDVIEIDAASNNGVDEIRELKDKVKFLPAVTKYKIYIIDEVHMLSTSAFNALLKTLEEPPKHIIFILATTEPHKVLPTIVSRCQRFDFKTLLVEDIMQELADVCNKEKISYDIEALKEIAISSDGGMRDALSFLDQAISLSDNNITEEVTSMVTGNVSKEKLLRLADNIEDKKITESLQIVRDVLNSGIDTGKIINSILKFYRDILLCKTIETQKYNEQYKEFSKAIDIKKVYYYIDIISDVQGKIRFTTTPEIFLEVAIIKMINTSSTELDYGHRITELENKLNEGPITGSDITIDVAELKRLRILEEKFNNLLTELSKLELPKLIERVKTLETSPSLGGPDSTPSLKALNLRVDKIIEDLELLKIIQETLSNQIDNAQTGGLDENLLNEKVEDAIKKVKPNVNYTEVENFINRQLNYFKEEIENRIKELKEEIDRTDEQIEETITTENIEVVSKPDNVNESIQEIEKLKDRLSKIESNVYKIMSGLLSSQPAMPQKKNKQKVNDKQISIWQDDIINTNKITEPVEETNTDFGSLSQEESLKDESLEETSEIVEKQSTDLETLSQEDISKDEYLEEINKNEEEKEIVETEEDLNKEFLEDNNKAMSDTEFEEDILDNGENLFATPEDKPLDEPRKDEQENNLEPVIGDLNEESQEDIAKEIINSEDDVEKANTVVLEEPIITNNNLIEEELDEYERYDIKVLERIMNDSRSDEAINDRKRVMNILIHLVALSPVDKRGVAELLKEGEVRVVGNHEFVITYDNVSICNKVMQRRFKRIALKMLYDLLDGDYNYLAITHNHWIQKRREYSDQYVLGVKNPILTPFNDPNLKVDNNDDGDNNEGVIKRASDLFENKINVKKGSD